MVDYNDLKGKGSIPCQDRVVIDRRRKKKAKLHEGTSVGVEVVHIDSDSDESTGESPPKELQLTTSREDSCLGQPISDKKFEFHIFQTHRTQQQELFVKGQVWAIYDEYEMPRRYVQIENSSSSTSRAVYVTYLKRVGLVKREEEQYNITKETTGSCRPVFGAFVAQSKGLQVCPSAFSHMASHHHHSRRIRGKLYHFIYPKTGEVWAMFKNVDTDTDTTCSSPRLQKYQLVEILTDCNEKDGMKVVYLMKAEGRYRYRYRSLFRRLGRDHSGEVVISGSQLNRLSHKIPSFKIEGTTSCCYELDSSAVPLHVDDFKNKEPNPKRKLSYEILCMKFLDHRSFLMKERFIDNTIWAAYDDKDSKPRRYGLITETLSGRQCTTWLEPCPTTEDERNWYEAGYPVGCGRFRPKKTVISTGQDRSMFSHPMQYNWDSVGNQYEICPRKGEVWGMVRYVVLRNRTKEPKFEYDFVEILTNFDRNEGVRGVYLAKTEHFGCLFERQMDENGVEVPFVADGYELYKFSYRVLDCKIQEKIGGGVRKESFLLDPFVAVFQNNADDNSNVSGQRQMKTEEEERKKFKPGEVWALYDVSDWIPRSYAIVNKTFPCEDNVEVTMLKPHPVLEQEMEWVDDNNLPMACGTFRVSKDETFIRKASEFSHLVIPCEDEEEDGGNNNKKQKSFYKIFPKENEVWATYKDLENIKQRSRSNPEEPAPEYQMVQVLSNFSENCVVGIASLVRVEGPSELIFRRQILNGFALIKSCSRNDLRYFSHQVIDSRIIEDDGDDDDC